MTTTYTRCSLPGRIFGDEFDAVFALHVTFQGGLSAVDERYHDVPGPGAVGVADNSVVPVVDADADPGGVPAMQGSDNLRNSAIIVAQFYKCAIIDVLYCAFKAIAQQ